MADSTTYWPALRGRHSQGGSLDEAIASVREAVEVHLASVEAHSQRVPREDLLIRPVEVPFGQVQVHWMTLPPEPCCRLRLSPRSRVLSRGGPGRVLAPFRIFAFLAWYGRLLGSGTAGKSMIG